MDARVKRSIHDRYRAHVLAHLRTARLWPMGTIFWGLALSTVILVGATFGPEWGLTFGTVSAFLFLADLFLHPFTDLPEIYAQTQTAIAGWRKILALLELPVEIAEPTSGVTLSGGALAVRAEDVSYRYGDGPLVLRDVSFEVPAGAHVAVVGETGSGKTTFCKLLTRLADPVRGRIELEGADLREVAPASRRGAVRMVPQDGFLFDLTVRENVRAGREGATDREVEAAFDELGLGDWVESLPDGHRHAGGRAGRVALGRRASARLAREGADRQPGRADPRRGHERGGSRHRTADLRGAPSPVGGPHHDHDRAPPEHGRGRRRDLRLRRRAHRGARDARRARRGRRDVRRALPQLARQRSDLSRGPPAGKPMSFPRLARPTPGEPAVGTAGARRQKGGVEDGYDAEAPGPVPR